jgi:hypothetical protein
MFNNKLLLATTIGDVTGVNPALVDGPTNHRTLRSITVVEDSKTVTYELSIGHQPSNELVEGGTRPVVRLSRSHLDEETGKEV